ncbi:MAG: hypothetical protein IKS09_03105, partial [Lachnospiraceae bacterium]|nr:hypothetical protein [Lachnospiraceae bacterium]
MKDIAASVKGYYNISGGRVFAHALVYLSLMFNEHIFDFLNATAFISLGILILKCAVSGKVIKPQMLALTYLMMILFLPAFGDTCLWVSGSINYLWMAIISLLFIWCVINEKYYMSLPLALISGFTNEATGGMLIVFLLAYCLFNKKKSGIKIILQMLLLIPGELVIVMAPGNTGRAKEVNGTSIFSVKKALEMVKVNFRWLFETYYILIIFTAFFVFFAVKNEKMRRGIPFLVSAISGLVAMALSGTFIERSHFLNIVMLMTALLAFVTAFSEQYGSRMKEFYETKMSSGKKEIIKKYRWLLDFLIIVILLAFIIPEIISFYKASEIEKDNSEAVELAVKKEQCEVTVPYYYNEFYASGILFPMECYRSREYTYAWMG